MSIAINCITFTRFAFLSVNERASIFGSDQARIGKLSISTRVAIADQKKVYILFISKFVFEMVAKKHLIFWSVDCNRSVVI